MTFDIEHNHGFLRHDMLILWLWTCSLCSSLYSECIDQHISYKRTWLNAIVVIWSVFVAYRGEYFIYLHVYYILKYMKTFLNHIYDRHLCIRIYRLGCLVISLFQISFIALMCDTHMLILLGTIWWHHWNAGENATASLWQAILAFCIKDSKTILFLSDWIWCAVSKNVGKVTGKQSEPVLSLVLFTGSV